MEIDTWVDGYKVRSFPWIDGKTIYFNVQCYLPGQSLSQPPAWDKTVYITDDAAGRDMAENLTSSLTEYVARLQIADGEKVVLTASSRNLKGGPK
jgi:hypothetical protein